EQRLLVVSGLSIPFLERPGIDPAILLVHGFASGGFIWKKLLRELAVPNRLLAPELPGNGLAGVPKQKLSKDYYVQFLEEFRLAAGLRDFHAIGHSMGAAFLAEYSRRFKNILSLVLESPADDQLPM